MRGRFWVRWLAFAVCGRAASASAADVEWQGPDPCPDAAELRFSIERIIGMPLSHALPLHFQVRAERAPEGYVARMDVAVGHDQQRRRVLVASDCSQLADLVAVTTAIALGANDVTANDEGANDAVEVAETAPALDGTDVARAEGEHVALHGGAPPVATDQPSSDELASPSDRSAAWSPAASLWFLADAGSLGRPGTGMALGVGLGHAPLQLRALGTWLFDQPATFEAGRAPGAGAELGLAAAALSVCAAPWGPSSTWSIQGCAGWELGRLSGKGQGIERPRSGAALWSTPRLDATFGWGLGPQGLEVGAMLTLAAPFARDDFVLGDLGSVHRPAALVGRAALGINWTLE